MDFINNFGKSENESKKRVQLGIPYLSETSECTFATSIEILRLIFKILFDSLSGNFKDTNKMASSGGSTYFDDVIVRNLQAAMFQRTTHDLDDRIVSMDAVDNYVVIGTAKHGCQVFK